MIYLDNAATSHFKPKSVLKAAADEITNSSNSGRSGHRLAIANAIKIEKCRRFLLEKFGAEDGFQLVFTKNCTEALNLAIRGLLESGDSAVCTSNDHNSVLRPLFDLKQRNGVDLGIAYLDFNSAPEFSDLEPLLKPETKLVVLNLVSNVTGAVCDIEKTVAQISKHYENSDTRPAILIDGAQGVPVVSVDMKKMRVDMLAAPAHKGLHGIQGLGFLIFNSNLKLNPIMFGGTGTASESVYQPLEPPEAFESGTLNSPAIHALLEGAKWSFDNVSEYSLNIKYLANILVSELKSLKAAVYASDTRCGVVSFNLDGKDSAQVADILNREFDIAVRSGLHCAPLVHKQLGTLSGGAVRCSLGVETSQKDIEKFIAAVKTVNKYKKSDMFRN